MNAIIIALIGAIPPTLIAYLAWKSSIQNAKAIQDVHISINSRMDQLLKTTKSDSLQEGREIGRNESNPL